VPAAPPPSPPSRMRGITAGGPDALRTQASARQNPSRQPLRRSQIADEADQKGAAARENREGGGSVTDSQPALLAPARARGAKSRRGMRPTAQPRGNSKKAVAAWAATWERPAVLLSATAATGHATNSATPVACTVLRRSRCSFLVCFPSSLCLICFQMTEFLA
jgi:hypothetical protein